MKNMVNSNQDKIFDTVVNVSAIIVMLLIFYPLYFIVIASFSSPEAVNGGDVLLIPKGFSFGSYRMVFNDMRIWIGYKNTLIYTTFGTLLGVAMTILAGYSLSRDDLRGKNIIMGIFVFTMYFSGGLIPTYMLINKIGLYNKPYTLIILGSLGVTNIIISRTFFKTTISKELLEAAFIDGCSNGYFFFRIVAPLSKAIISVMALYYAVGHWNSYFNALIYISNQKYYPLQMILRDILVQSLAMQVDLDTISASEQSEMAEAVKYAVIILSSLPIIMFYPLIQKNFIKGVMIGSIKG